MDRRPRNAPFQPRAFPNGGPPVRGGGGGGGAPMAGDGRGVGGHPPAASGWPPTGGWASDPVTGRGPPPAGAGGGGAPNPYAPQPRPGQAGPPQARGFGIASAGASAGGPPPGGVAGGGWSSGAPPPGPPPGGGFIPFQSFPAGGGVGGGEASGGGGGWPPSGDGFYGAPLPLQQQQQPSQSQLPMSSQATGYGPFAGEGGGGVGGTAPGGSSGMMQGGMAGGMGDGTYSGFPPSLGPAPRGMGGGGPPVGGRGGMQGGRMMQGPTGVGYGPSHLQGQLQQPQQPPRGGHPPPQSGGGGPIGYPPSSMDGSDGRGAGTMAAMGAGGVPARHSGAARPEPVSLPFNFGAMAAAMASSAATSVAASGGIGPQAALGAQLLRQMVPGGADDGGDNTAARAAFSQQTARMSAAARLPKYYFAVTNGYVLHKLMLLLFPFRHRSWRRRQLAGDDGDAASGSSPGEYLPPREDINAPDLYIPVMAFVTYVLLVAFVHGTQSRFRPDTMASTGTLGVGVLGVEVLAIKLCLYLVNARPVAWLDIVAFRGYKFVGVVLAMAAGFVHRRLYWVVLMGSAFSMGLFLMRSHRGVVLSKGDDVDDERGGVGVRRNYFLLGLLVLQFPIYWALGVQP